MRRAKARARLELFGSAALFGLMASVARLASHRADGFGAAQLTTVRFAVGAAMTAGLFLLRPGTFRPRAWGLLAARGVFGGLAVVFYFVALTRIPAGEATLLNNTFPVAAVLLAIVLLGERPTIHLGVALAITTTGVVLVMGGGSVLHVSLGPGELAGIVSAVFGAAAVTAIRRARATENAATIFFAFCLGGLLVSVPFATGAWPRDPMTWILGLAVGGLSFGAQMLMTDAYGALTVGEAAVWQQLTPVASFVWAVPVLGEAISAGTALGVLVGAAGVAYGSVLGHRPPGDARKEPIAIPVEPG
jgi:drug/metabolite transporter (DMT)-like permease